MGTLRIVLAGVSFLFGMLIDSFVLLLIYGISSAAAFVIAPIIININFMLAGFFINASNVAYCLNALERLLLLLLVNFHGIKSLW